MAYRVALATKDALDLPTAAIASDGRGATQPLASNETARGRALNRRVEVEFWYDDPLQELPDEPQLCPDDAGAEVVTKVYDPPSGRVRAARRSRTVRSRSRRATPIRCATRWTEIHDKANVRLRFVGHTRNERLDRRTALRVRRRRRPLRRARAPRDGEGRGRARRSADAQVEHEGRGYVHSDDVVNSGFVEGETSDVQVEVVYDELAVLDNYEGVDVTPLTRELRPKNPLGLNLMRITVDGEPIDDPGRSSADIQRCTDVALDKADIRFGFDNLRVGAAAQRDGQPELDPGLRVRGRRARRLPPVRFRAYNNYAAFIDRSEVRIFEPDQSPQADAARRPRGRERTASPSGSPIRAAFAGARARALRTCCAPTTRRATSTRPRRSRSGGVRDDAEPAAPETDEQVKRELLAGVRRERARDPEHSRSAAAR